MRANLSRGSIWRSTVDELLGRELGKGRKMKEGRWAGKCSGLQKVSLMRCRLRRGCHDTGSRQFSLHVPLLQQASWLRAPQSTLQRFVMTHTAVLPFLHAINKPRFLFMLHPSAQARSESYRSAHVTTLNSQALPPAHSNLSMHLNSIL